MVAYPFCPSWAAVGEPVTAGYAAFFFSLYGTRLSVIAHRPLEDWGKLIGDVPSASAILDRFLETAEIISFQGRSYRLRNRTADAPSKPSKVLTGKTRTKSAGTSGTSATK